MRKFLCLLALVLLSAGSAQAKSPVIAYYPFWVSYSQTKAMADLPLSRLDQLTYAFAHFAPDGQLLAGDVFADLNKTYTQPDGSMLRGNYALLKSLKAQHPQLKTVLAVGGWNYSADFSTIFADPALRLQAVQSTVLFLQQHGFDGIEIDWRYPGGHGREGNAASVKDGANLLRFVTELRAAKPELIIGVTAGVLNEQISAVPWTELAPKIDYAMLLATDFVGAWSKATGHKSPLYSDQGQLSIDSAVNTLERNGLPLAKLALLIPTQGVSFNGVASEQNGLGQIHHGVSMGSWDNEQTGATGIFGQDEIAALQLGNGFAQHWDEAAQASTYYSPSLQQFISVETPRALASKLNYARARHLLGVALWEITSDASAQSLLRQTEIAANPLRAYQNDLRLWWRYHPVWVELLAGVVVGLSVLALVSWGLIRHRRRQQQEIELSQLRCIKGIIDDLPSQLGQLRQLSLAAPASNAVQQWPLPQWAEVADRIAWQIEPLQPQTAATTARIAASNDEVGVLPQSTQPLPVHGAESSTPSPLSNLPAQLGGQRIAALSMLTQRLSEQRSLEKMLEVTLGFLADDPLIRQAEVQQLDDDEAASPVSAEPIAPASQLHAVLDDYQLNLQFKGALSEDDQLYYRSVIEQVRIVRRSLYELGKQPQLLSELYEIASRRDKLLFIRADKGYSAIFAQDLVAPSYITLRLRAIRLYFDEGVLLQVHRSYLVNPKKVQGIKKRARDTWELQIGSEMIPVSRQYLSRLRQVYPQWFSAAEPA
ncbi:LytTR family transcriptional regulator DNA-binding domain-containing protein [Chitinibacter bivalviorum]|uniref:chitinase n=1 Tax=Chitinibacter bivalviorum TaxID=2739434 RepID=A0A7H9BJK3_9NEIS|nr:glycosyl hydrolase family 18 protein [Chitinibacter bivalviorum]QLG88649.1 LytTR family transcriptional regulator DNA-binding domain-containing protein [Chitinibacter bivalviorum]